MGGVVDLYSLIHFGGVLKIFVAKIAKRCSKEGRGSRNDTGNNTWIFDEVLYLFFLTDDTPFWAPCLLTSLALGKGSMLAP